MKSISTWISPLWLILITTLLVITLTVNYTMAIVDLNDKVTRKFLPGGVVIGNPGVGNSSNITANNSLGSKSIGDPNLIDDPTQRIPNAIR